MYDLMISAHSLEIISSARTELDTYQFRGRMYLVTRLDNLGSASFKYQ